MTNTAAPTNGRWEAVFQLPIGYTDDKFGGVKRRPLSEVALHDRFGNPWRG